MNKGTVLRENGKYRSFMRKIRVDEHITLILQFAQRACTKVSPKSWIKGTYTTYGEIVKCCWKDQLSCSHREYLFHCGLDPEIRTKSPFPPYLFPKPLCRGGDVGIGNTMPFSLLPKPLGRHSNAYERGDY